MYVIKTTNGGATWDTLTVASNMWELTDIEFYDYNHGILMEGANIYQTEDVGENWTFATHIATTGYMVDYLDANTLVIVGNENSRHFKPENRTFVDNIIKELESSSTKDTWEEFELRFQQVHTDFYNKLTEQFPDLTSNDLKLCAFLRLNMSTKEISAITYQSYNTLSTARYRLQKKLGLDDHANLVSFLTQL